MSKKIKKQVPELRFPEFKGDWIEKKLSDISNKISDGIHSTPKYDEDGEYYFINGNNLIDTKIEFNESTKRIDKSEYLKYRSELTSQTILISINGTIGNLAFYNNEKIVLGKSACYINLKLEENKLFIFCLLQTSSIKNHFSKELTGSTIYNLSLTTIKNTKVLFPSYKEQEKIAIFLGSIDTRLTQLRRKHELLQTSKRGVMQKIFSEELRFKDDDGSDFPDWKKKILGEIVVGGFSNGVFNDPNKLGRGYRLINVKDMYNGNFIDIDSLSRLELDDQEFRRNKAEYGDIFFTRSSLVKEGIAHSNILLSRDQEITYDGHLIRFRFDHKSYLPEFVALALKANTTRKQLVSRGKTGTMTTIGQDDLATVKLSIPSKEEQEKIAIFLTAIDRKLEAVAQQIDRTEQFKKGLLQKMFV